MSGFEFSRKLKAQKPIMPVLMVTGRDDIDSLGLARRAGIDGYLVKPVGARELLQKITFIVGRTCASRDSSVADDAGELLPENAATRTPTRK